MPWECRTPPRRRGRAPCCRSRSRSPLPPARGAAPGPAPDARTPCRSARPAASQCRPARGGVRFEWHRVERRLDRHAPRGSGLESGATRDNRENSAGRPHLDDAAVEREAPGHVLHHVPHADRRAARRYRITPLQRSEEHTSELQSPCNLVCRLLLEKKKEQVTLVRPALAPL